MAPEWQRINLICRLDLVVGSTIVAVVIGVSYASSTVQLVGRPQTRRRSECGPASLWQLSKKPLTFANANANAAARSELTGKLASVN